MREPPVVAWAGSGSPRRARPASSIVPRSWPRSWPRSAPRLLALAGLLAGCGQESSRPPEPPAGEADVHADGGRDGPYTEWLDAAPPDAAAADAYVPPDAAWPPDFAPPPVALPLPAGVLPPQRILRGDDRLAGDGATSCSEPAVAGADRWCVFHRPGAAPPAAELWVMNLSKAAKGELPACDGTSADCVRLTSTLWTGAPLGGPAHPYSHQFNGDTLFFYADSAAGRQELYRGPVYAWRPGWPSPRSLTSPDGVMCFGHPTLPLAHCLDTIGGDPMMPDSFELRAGSLAEIPSAPLPSLGRFRPLRASGEPAWQAGFSADGRSFLVSSLDPDPEVETLRAVPVEGLGRQPLAVVLQGVTNWIVGHDGRRIYYERKDAPDEHGLYSADFPAGTGETKISGRITDYLLLGNGPTDQGVSFLATLARDYGAFRLVRDSRMPETFVTVFNFRDMLEDVHMSADLRYTSWLDAAFKARVVRHADRSSCTLNTYPEVGAFEPQLLGSAGLVFWNEDTPLNDGNRDAFFGRPDDCKGTTRFASRIAYYAPLGDRGLVYTDESDLTQKATLKYAVARRQGDAWTLETPVRVHGALDDGSFTLLGAPPAFVLFRTSDAEAGTWVFGPLPF